MRTSVLSHLVWPSLIAALASAQISPSAPAFSKWTALSPSYLYGVTGDTSGNVYVASESSPGTAGAIYLLTKVAPDGSIVYQTKLPYMGPLAAGDSGSVWVLGAGKVDAQGKLTAVSMNGEAFGTDAAGRVYLATNPVSGIVLSMLDTSGKVLATSNTGIQGRPNALAVDSAGAVYLTGTAFSSDFVATPGAFQTTYPPNLPSPLAFVAKIAPGLGSVVYATLLGGGTSAACNAIVVDSAGEAIVGGSVSNDTSNPNVIPFQLTDVGLPLLRSDDFDAFVLKLSADGSHLIYSLGLGYGAVSSLAVGVDGTVHVAGSIGPPPGPYDPIFLGGSPSLSIGLMSIDPQGSILLEQHLAPVPSSAAGVAVAADGSPRLVTTIASQEFPPVYADQPPAPYVIDALASPPVADISVTAATVQPLVGTLDFRVTVANAGPAPAEGVHVVLPPGWNLTNYGFSISPVECIPGAGTICYQPGYAVINSLGAGESKSIEFIYSCGQTTPTSNSNLTVPIEVFAATFDPNPGNNKFTLTVPIVSGQLPQFGIDPGDLTFYRSDYPGAGPCAYCPAADPHLTVWAPTPQTSQDGNTWYFDSWSDGVKDNPRAFDASRPLPYLQIKFLPGAPVSLSQASLDFVALPGISPPQRSLLVGAFNSEDSVSVGAPADPWLSISAVFQGYDSYDGINKLVTGTVSTAGLAPGYYTSSFPVTLTTSQSTTQTIHVPVSLRIMDQVPTISANGVVNAASYAGGTISQLEIISIFGSGLGPQQAATAMVPQAGSLPTVLGGTRVLVSRTINSGGGFGLGPDPVELLFVQDGQISAMIPDFPNFSYAQNVLVQVEVGGIPGPTMSFAAAANAPGLFTSNASGRGNLAAINSDGTINSPSNPAKRGTYISLYGTGLTATGANGFSLPDFGANLLVPAAGIVEALIGTEPADVEYAGIAPGLVTAAQQINVLIPADSQIGSAVPIQIGVLNTASTALAWVWTQTGATIAIQ
jgi:uncharacterized protein (TIGR03437 family)